MSAVAGAILVDPLGWAGKAHPAVATVDEYAGFAILRPGEARPASRTSRARGAVIPEASAGVPATVRTSDITDAWAEGSATGPLTGTYDGLLVTSVNRLQYLTGETVADTLVFKHIATGRVGALTASPSMPLPFPILAQGNPRDGYIEFQRVSWLPRPGVAIAPAFVATGLWLEGDTLFRLEIVSEMPIGPEGLESVLRPVAASVHRTEHRG
jgi:hypothetical protein